MIKTPTKSLTPLIWVFLVLNGMLLSSLKAQFGHPYFRNYNTENGLPSPETHGCRLDTAGYLWVATDNGLARFNGYEFEHFGTREGLPELPVMALQTDTFGQIWGATLSGRLFQIQQDSIVTFAGNTHLPAPEDVRFFYQLDILDDNTKIVNFFFQGIWAFNGNEVNQIISDQPITSLILKKWKNDNWFFTISKPLFGSDDPSLSSSILLPLGIERSDTSYQHNIPFTGVGTNISCWPTSNGTYRLSFNSHKYHFDGQKISQPQRIDYLTRNKMILELADGKIWVGCLNGKGIRQYANLAAWDREEYQTLLTGKSITELFQDRQGGIWVSTLENGIYHCPMPNALLYDQKSGLDNPHITALTFVNQDTLYFGTRNGRVYQWSQQDSTISPLPELKAPKRIIRDLYYDPLYQKLWVFTPQTYQWAQNKWQLKARAGFDKCYPIPQQNGLLGGLMDLIYFLDFEKDSLSKLETLTADSSKYVRNFVVRQRNDGRVWMSNKTGLWELQDSTKVRPSNWHPTLRTRMDDIAELADGPLVLATKGEGLLLYSDTSFLQLTTTDGLSTNIIENLYVDEQDRIWLGTMQGINRLSAQTNGQWMIEHFTTWHGLPTNEITAIRSYQGQIWIATTKGLLRWQEPFKDEQVAAPVFTKLTINDQQRSVEELAQLAYYENNVQFQFLTINLEQDGQTPYRYRLQQQDWIYTSERQLQLTALTAGNYLLEVQSQNRDGQWSRTLRQTFHISLPWWQQWWFYSLVGLATVAMSYGFYRNRIQTLAKEYSLRTQVDELEKKALRAQMNPHFIFNCLNSIQLLIQKGDKEAAMTYLSRFAQLVRATLNSSINGEISLEEEVTLLHNYLNLEKLRFKDAFHFRIQVDEELDLFDTVFPPMLLQPYIENAVIHGMANKNKDGQITIQFQQNTKHILARIIDNGPGIYQHYKLDSRHQSVGMTLTGKRLELLHGDNQQNWVDIREITDSEGKVKGTTVEVTLKTV